MASVTILYIFLALIIAFMISYFQYFYKSYKTRTTVVLALLRFLEVFGLLLLVINPKIKSLQFINVKPTLNVVVDNSLSISYAKQTSKVQTFFKKIKVNKAIQDKFDVNFYAFSEDLNKQDTFNFTSSETNIFKTLQSLDAISKGNTAPILLITDGNQTYGPNYEYYNSHQPIYPIIVGDTLKHDDIRIHQINANAYANLKHKFPVEVFIQYDGENKIKKRFTVQLNHQVVYKKLLEFDKQKSSQHLQFYLPASAIGNHHFVAKIQPLTDEYNTVNNRNHFSVEVINEHAKILILSSVKHPDIGMMKRAIESNKQRKVTIITNLNNNIQLKYYQLVILYQPNIKFTKIFNNIKTSSTNFFVVTGTKTDWNFLNKAQSYFHKNNIAKTEKYGALFNSSFNEFQIDDIGFSNFPPLLDYFGEIQFSVAHQTLLNQTISEFSTATPLLAIFTETNRKGAVFFGEDSWKWRMLTKVETQSFKKFDEFFSKLIQYLSSNKRSSRLKIGYQPFTYVNKDVQIMAEFFDANYQFDATANLKLTLTKKNTRKQKEYPFTLTDSNYKVILSNLKPDEYTFIVSVNNHQHTKTGKFTILPYNVEQQLLTANTTALKRIARSSNGNIFHIDETNSLYKNLVSDKRYVTVQKSVEKIVSLFELKWILGLLILLLSLEWFIRKYRGLV